MRPYNINTATIPATAPKLATFFPAAPVYLTLVAEVVALLSVFALALEVLDAAALVLTASVGALATGLTGVPEARTMEEWSPDG